MLNSVLFVLVIGPVPLFYNMQNFCVSLQKFLFIEINDVLNGNRSSCINCSAKEIETLVNSLGLSVADLPDEWQTIVEAIENF